MKIIGLTGGIASGKSAVASELAALGAVVLDADRAAHEVLNLPNVQLALVERWGKNVLKSSGEIDRTIVAQHVFSDEESGRSELRFLEKTLHPRIREQFEAKLAELSAVGTAVAVPVAVIDAPLLLEAGWETLCDSLVFVDSPRSERLRRASLRNWSEEEFANREALQMPIAEKRQRSTHVLDNSGTQEDLRELVRVFWASLGTTDDKTS